MERGHLYGHKFRMKMSSRLNFGNGACSAPCFFAHTLLLHVAKTPEKRTIYRKTHQAEGHNSLKHPTFLRFTAQKPRRRQRFRADSERNSVKPYTSRRSQLRLDMLVTARLVPHPCTVCCTKRQKRCRHHCFGHYPRTDAPPPPPPAPPKKGKNTLTPDKCFERTARYGRRHLNFANACVGQLG